VKDPGSENKSMAIYKKNNGAVSGTSYSVSVSYKGFENPTSGTPWIGIDPNGGTDPASGSIQWAAGGQNTAWTTLTKSGVTANGSAITIFIKLTHANTNDRCEYRFDCLTMGGGSGGTPVPTNTPLSGNTPPSGSTFYEDTCDAHPNSWTSWNNNSNWGVEWGLSYADGGSCGGSSFFLLIKDPGSENKTIAMYKRLTGATSGVSYTATVEGKGFENPTSGTCSIGIDPAGGTDPSLGTIQWGTGPQGASFSSFSSPAATANGNAITIFIKLTHGNFNDRCMYRFDCVKVTGGGGGTLPTNTPIPGQPTNTPNPNQTPSSSYFGPPWIFGMHDPGGEYLFEQKGKRGWVLITEGIGSNPGDYSGSTVTNYADIANRGHGIIVRLNSHYGDMCIPNNESEFPNFARRCANFAAAEPAAHIWVIGNEMNLCCYQQDNVLKYARCLEQVYTAIRGVPGHESDIICPGAPAIGSVDYASRLFQACEGKCNGLAIHTYTNGFGCGDVTRPEGFGEYKQVMQVIPTSMRSFPVFLTECGSGYAGTYPQTIDACYVNSIYQEINNWNNNPPTGQKILTVCFYRWKNWDIWGIETKTYMHNQFLSTCENDYRWYYGPAPTIPGANTPTPAGPTPTPCTNCGGGTLSFESMPSWSSTWESTSNQAVWSIATGGQIGNCLMASRTGDGSSSKVIQLTTSGSSLPASVYMKTGGIYSGCFWMETACRAGVYAAQDFDSNATAWTMVQKYDGDCGGYPNGNTGWQQYQTTISTGGQTNVSIGFKFGGSGAGSVTGYWDEFVLGSSQVQPTNTPIQQQPTNTPIIKPCIKGDVNCDSDVTPGDALKAFQLYLETFVPIGNEPCNVVCGADMNNDGQITPGDALCIFREYLEIPC